VQFGILGPLDVRADGEAVGVGGAKARTVLATLLLNANEPVSGDRLAAALWGEDVPASGIKTVQVYVSRLRKTLGDARVETTPAGYVLRLGPDELDLQRFDQLVTGARRELAGGQPQQAAAGLREALALWRGEPLSDLADEPFAAAEIRRLDELRAETVELALDADLAAGRHREVAGELEALAIAHPLREHVHAMRMLALYRSGRQAESLAAYRDARELLVDAAGIEPGAELRHLHEAMLRQDPALDLAAAELPEELDASAAPPLVGRDRELRRLREHWERALQGRGSLIALAGPSGSGKTRLAAELAGDAHRAGAVVIYAAGDGERALAAAARATRPTLLVLDGAPPRQPPDLSGAPALAVVTVGQAAAGALVLGPLDADAVRAIVRLYAPDALPGDVPVSDLLANSEGLPRRVHELAGEWARGAAARRVGADAGRAASRRAELRRAESELAGSVAGLQELRERADLVTRDERGVVCPFKGLASFETADAPYFFGRERLVAELVARLVGSPLLGIVGPSGSGKSSVVRAGLLPALAGGVLPGSADWPQCLIRPGEKPFDELRRGWSGSGVLVVDQFEETFTGAADEGQRVAFANALARAGADRRALVVLALRADFYGRCAAYPELAELLAANTVLVGAMRADELRRAIERPARRAGLRVEPELVDALVADVRHEPGALPLLSTALLELWQQRDGRDLRRSAYAATGGVRGAVARLAEDAYGRLDPVQRATARKLLVRLAADAPGGGVVRRQMPVTQLGEDVAPVLSVLTERRLLTVSDATVEVAHEALLSEWPRLAGWLEADAESRRAHRHLSDAAREWDERGREPGDVYRGSRLAMAVEWRTEHADELEERESAFLDAAQAAGDRARRRLRAVLAGMAGLLVLAVAIGIAALHQRNTARAEARTAIAQQLDARALGEDNLDRSLLLARQAVDVQRSPDTESALLSALLRAPAAIGVVRIGRQLTAIDLRRDGGALAIGDWRGGVHFVDPRTRRPVGRPYESHSDGYVDAVRFSPDGTRVAVVSRSDLDLLDGHTFKLVDAERLPDGSWSTGLIEFSSDSTTLAVPLNFGPIGRGSTTNFVTRWDARTGRRIGGMPEISPPGYDVAGFTGDLTRVVAVSPARHETLVADVTNGRPLRRIDTASKFSAVSPDGRLVALGTSSGVLRLLDLATGTVRAARGRSPGGVVAIRFSPDSRTLLTSGNDHRVTVWDVARGAVAATLSGHAGDITGLAVSPDGRTAYSASTDASVIAWDLAGQRRLGRAFSAAHGVLQSSAIAATPDGAWFAVGERSGDVELFDAGARVKRRVAVIPGHPVTGVAVAPGGRSFAAAAGRDGNVAFVDSRTSRPLPLASAATREELSQGVESPLAFSGDGRWLAAGSNATLTLWDARRRTRVKTIAFPGLYPVDLGTSPDGGRLAVTLVGAYAASSELRVISLPGLAVLRRIVLPLGYTGRFTADGKLFLEGDGNGALRTYDASTWKLRGGAMAASRGGVASVSSSRDGRAAGVVYGDGTARLWDLTSRRPLGPVLPGPRNAVAAVVVDHGTHLATISSDGRGYLLDVRPSTWMRRACDVAGRTLTRAEWREALPQLPYAPACRG
jgi:DNA-binding SARP family transcriptional activator/WD40 repeat protein/energy-coupling factor transporter ATP-binding protein EcfA2